MYSWVVEVIRAHPFEGGDMAKKIKAVLDAWYASGVTLYNVIQVPCSQSSSVVTTLLGYKETVPTTSKGSSEN